jgi:hypothetical protein
MAKLSLGGAYDPDAYGTVIFPEDPELRIVNSTIADTFYHQI